MKENKKCICCLFMKIPIGTIVTVQLSERSITFIFIKKIGDCIYGLTNEGCIVIECNSIISVQCGSLCCIVLNNPGPISCTGTITGRVSCRGIGISGVIVNLSGSPNIISFANPNPITNQSGEFSTTVTVSENTPLTDVVITAQAKVNQRQVQTMLTTSVDCITCQNPMLSLSVPTAIECEGNITGSLTCDDTPLEGVALFFEVIPNDGSVVVFPNPVTTTAGGNISATIQSIPGVDATYTLTGSATIGGQVVTSGPSEVEVSCPLVECSCKVNLGTAGSSQPGAIINVNGTILTGTLNINVLECGASINAPCNPSVDNFNFTFNASNGNTYQFTQGRRISLLCSDNTATLIGVAQGSINNGPKATYNVTITANLDTVNDEITWTIDASDGTNTFQTSVPFTAASTPQSFIASCNNINICIVKKLIQSLRRVIFKS